jgi:hypothetical protein
VAEPQRKAPRWPRTLRFQADDGFSGDVQDLSAVGLRVLCGKVKKLEPGGRLIGGTLTFENGTTVRIKVRVARVSRESDKTELGLEIAEADKSFYDALPRLRKDTGETPIAGNK